MPRKSAKTSQPADSLQDILRKLDLDTHCNDEATMTRVILDGMRMAKDNALVQAQGCKKLAELARLNVSKRVFLEEGIGLVLSAMKTHINDVTVQQMGCFVLSNLCVSSGEYLAVIRDEGAASALTCTLKRHMQDPQIAYAACSILSPVLERTQVVPDFLKEGGTALTMRAMRTHMDNAEVQAVCSVIVMHTINFDKVTRASYIREGIVDALVCAMKKHKNTASTQIRATAALHAFSMGGPEFVALLWKSGAIDCVLHAMETFTCDAGQQEAACKLFALVALGIPKQEEAHTRSLFQTEGAYERQLQNNVAAAERLASKGVSVAIIKALETHMHCREIHTIGVMAVYNMATSSPKICEQVAKEGCMRVMVNGIDAHHKDSALMDGYLPCVVNLLFSISMVDSFVSAGGLAAMVRVVETHQQASNIHDLALKALGNVVNINASMHDKVFSCGAKLLVQSMRMHAANKEVQISGTTLIQRFISSDESNKARLAAVGGIAALVQAMTLFDGEYIEAACELMAGFPVLTDMQVASIMFDQGGLAAMLSALKQHRHRLRVVVRCLAFLMDTVLDRPQWQNYVGREGGIQAIVNGMNMHKTEVLVQRLGLCAIGNLVLGNVENQDRVGREGAIRVLASVRFRYENDAKTQGIATHLLMRMGDAWAANADELFRLGQEEMQKRQETCVVCGRSAMEMDMRRLLKCSACTLAPQYCSAECQKAAWKEHKKQCKANPVSKTVAHESGEKTSMFQ